MEIGSIPVSPKTVERIDKYFKDKNILCRVGFRRFSSFKKDKVDINHNAYLSKLICPDGKTVPYFCFNQETWEYLPDEYREKLLYGALIRIMQE